MKIQLTIALLAGLLAARAEDTLPVLKAGTDVYTNVTVTSVTATDVYFKHAGGLGNAKLKNLDPEMQKHFNYDPVRVEEAKRKQALAGIRDGGQIWKFVPKGVILGPPVVGPDGAVYFSTGSYYFGSNVWGGQKVFAVEADGKPRWEWPTEKPQIPVCVATDGTLYLLRGDTLVAAQPADHSLKWELKARGKIVGERVFGATAPAVGRDGTIYFGCDGGLFYAVKPDGKIKWTLETGGLWSLRTPAIAADGTIYFGSSHGKLFAVTPAGKKKWDFDLGIDLPVSTAPALAPDGTIYVGAGYASIKRLVAFAPDGKKKWEAEGGSWRRSNIAVGPDGTVYCSPEHRNLRAFNPDGSLKWEFKKLHYDTHLAITRDGLIYAASGTTLQAINSNGTLRWTASFAGPSRYMQSDDFEGLGVGPDGLIYVTTGYALFVAKGSAGLVEAGWPMLQHDIRYSGNAAP